MNLILGVLSLKYTYDCLCFFLENKTYSSVRTEALSVVELLLKKLEGELWLEYQIFRILHDMHFRNFISVFADDIKYTLMYVHPQVDCRELKSLNFKDLYFVLCVYIFLINQ